MEISKLHDISVLHLFGEVSFMEMDLIERTLNSLKRAHQHKILIDMTSVDHIHYRVIRKLLENAKKFRSAQGDIKLVNTNKETKEVLRFVGADQGFEDYATISEAILSFLGTADPQEKLYQ